MKVRLPSRINLKIISATSVVLFTLLVSFIGVYAWFTTNRTYGDDMTGMKIAPSNGILKKLSIHELDINNNDGFVIDANTGLITGYYFNPTAKSEINIDWETAGTPEYNVNVPSLGQYSVLQKTNPLLLVFELTEALPSNQISITATAAQAYTPAQYDTMASGDGNPLSWVIKYSSKTYSTASLSNSDFTVSKGSLSSEGSFATVNNQGAVTSFTQTKTFYSGSTSSNITFVYVVIDYYEPAMEYFYDVNLGKDFIDDVEHDVPFTVDWTMVI